METAKEKAGKLREQMDAYTRENLIIAFSGGVDSSLLLKLACDSAVLNGTTVYAVTVHTTLHPQNDMAISKKVAEETGAVHIIMQVDELNEADIMNNPKDRCYRCKRCIFQKLKGFAQEKGIRTILEGTNEDDLHVYRPGIRALQELGIISPLAEAGLTKEEIRELAKELDLSVANRPSAPCLATRFPYGTVLSYELMKKVEAGEELLRSLGFYNIRIRIHQDVARIEVDPAEFEELLSKRAEMIYELKSLGFAYITMDLEGFRSGSMDLQ